MQGHTIFKIALFFFHGVWKRTEMITVGEYGEMDIRYHHGPPYYLSSWPPPKWIQKQNDFLEASRERFFRVQKRF